MFVSSYPVQKQLKSEQKKSLIVNNQFSNQELEGLQLSHTLQSPLSGNSQCLTENCSFTKLYEKVIEEPLLDIKYELIFSDLDKTEYQTQTLVYTNFQVLKNNIRKIRRSYNGLMMPINEIQINNQRDETYQLRIITKKFINHNFTINIRALCNFIEKLIQVELAFSSTDIIQFIDGSLHINPISLLRSQSQKQTSFEALKEVLQQVDTCQNIQMILNIFKDFENEDLEKLKSYQMADKDIQKLKLQFINLLCKRMQI